VRWSLSGNRWMAPNDVRLIPTLYQRGSKNGLKRLSGALQNFVKVLCRISDLRHFVAHNVKIVGTAPRFFIPTLWRPATGESHESFVKARCRISDLRHFIAPNLKIASMAPRFFIPRCGKRPWANHDEVAE
jgi:hypothetical protein